MGKYKRLVKCILAAWILCGVSNTACAEDYVTGFAAYIAGDYQTALKIWQPLAAQGNAQAQDSLGDHYHKGYGVIQDYVRAHMWWSLAATRGHAKSMKNAATLKRKMTSSQLRRANELAQICAETNFQNC